MASKTTPKRATAKRATASRATTTTRAAAKPKTSSKLSTRDAIEKVLTGKRTPMSVGDIAEAGIPLTNLKGATPKQTFYSVLYGEAKKADGLVNRVDAGMFILNPRRKK